MEKYGLQRGVCGLEARHTTTAQYYRDFLYFASKGNPLESGSRSSSTSFTTIRKKPYTVLRQKRNSQKLVRLFIISIFECHQDERL